MTPLAGGVYDLVLNNGQNYFTKEKMTLANTLQQQLVPMSLKDIPKDITRDGVIQGIGESLYKLYGGNVSDKRDFKKQIRKHQNLPLINTNKIIYIESIYKQYILSFCLCCKVCLNMFLIAY